MKIKMPEECQIDGCKDKPKYGIYYKKRWVYVCKAHEKEIGDDNERRLGGKR